MTLNTITHDGSFDIALGKSRKETSWKNKQMLWSELLARLCVTHRTAETHAEYLSFKRDRQDEIKDVGGFVGGYVHGGRRKSSSIMHRQLITLDIDFAESCTAFWDAFTMLYGNAACMYSTHKHSADKPRMRLILPLDRSVRPDEYEAIARHISGTLGIEEFDPTTFQPERLMYWPSTSKDGEYVFEWQDGEWLSADAVLASYRDWKDVSQWPVSMRVSALVLKGIEKQGDPLEKPGVVGAFCRTYGIHDVIDKYLSDVYSPCDVEGRYTYKDGSTSGGLVVYDDKYAYSHHGTDPTSGRLCNAFDLVRIHLYGLRDDESSPKTPVNKLPSYLAMVDLGSKDTEVKKLIVQEKTDNARQEFASVMPDSFQAEPEEDNWREKLDVDRKGNIYGTIDNIVLILENDSYFKGRIAFDDFEKCEVAVKDLPWRKVDWQHRRLIDRDDANIRHYLERAYGISHLAKTKDAMQVWAQKTVFHPVHDYLKGVKWDGKKRINTLFIDYQGAEDTEYTRVVTRKSLVAAVARIFKPGCKFDNIPVLVGKQGSKKSTIVAKLGKQWFSDSFSFNTLTKNETKSYEQLQGVWILEIAELSGMAKAEIESVKHFVSKTEDRFRVAYGHRTEIFPRQCIPFGTTNKWDFLKDPTGNRRYWPITVGVTEPIKDVFTDLTEDEINQIWAEAVHYYRNKESLHLPEEMAAIAAEVQEKHTEQHPWTEIVRSYLEEKVPENWHKMSRYERTEWLNTLIDFEDAVGERPVGVMYKSRVCIQELWHEALRKREVIDERSAVILRNIMSNMKGWEERKEALRFGTFGRQRRGYARIGFDAFLDDLSGTEVVQGGTRLN